MRLYVRALGYFRSDWKLVLTLFLVIALSTTLGLLAAWPMAVLVDSVLTTTPRTDAIHRAFLKIIPGSQLGQIIGLACIGLLIKLSQDGLGTIQSIVSNQINYNGLMRVRCDLYRKLQALNLAYHRSQPQGDAIYRLTSDAYGCQTILGVLIQTVVAAVTLVVMTVILAMRSPSLTLLAFSIAPILAAANVIFAKRFRQQTLECKELDTRFTTAIQRSLACIGLVQAFGREHEEFDRFHGTIRETIQAWWRLNRQQMAYNLIVGATFGIGGAMVFGYGGYLVYRDQFANPRPGGMMVGDLMVFTAYLGMLWGPLCNLTGFHASMQNGVAGAQRVFEVLDRDPVITDAPQAVDLPRQPRTLELRDVSFGYDLSQGAKSILRSVSAKIEPGQMVAFVGSSGVGKSTLLNLLPRFYDPLEGSIRLDGMDLRHIRIRSLRQHVALVLQESVILPTSIAENIAYGSPHATEEQIRAAARLAGAASFIEQLPQGYRTEIAEGGGNLSGGQRQRISIARALLTEAPFIIMDEPTSALDPLHEQHVTDALREIKGRRTVIIVSHRLSTVTNCDKIFVMDAGRIVEEGTHAELLARRGLYWRLACSQLKLDSRDALAA